MPPTPVTPTQAPVVPIPDPPADPPKSSPKNLYPDIKIGINEKPNRFYAFPLIGFLTKVIILIPVFIWMWLLAIIQIFISIINSFIVLFTGKYWKTAYDYNLGFMRLSIKVTYFIQGLTDKYPGFGFSIQDKFSVDVAFPENPNKFYAIPIIGGLIRIILLIPYFIFQTAISNGANIGVFVSFFPVLFMGKYPESTYELARDSVRVSMGSSAYMSGLSDKYPSFHISMNHQTIKIILIILGAAGLVLNLTFRAPAKVTPPTFNTPSINTTIPSY